MSETTYIRDGHEYCAACGVDITSQREAQIALARQQMRPSFLSDGRQIDYGTHICTVEDLRTTSLLYRKCLKEICKPNKLSIEMIDAIKQLIAKCDELTGKKET